MKRFSLPLFVLCAMLCLAGCNRGPDAAIVAILQQNAQAAQSENLAAYMNTYHSKAPGRQGDQVMMPKVFKDYNLKYTVADIEVESVTAEEIRVRYTLWTQKADNNGRPFRDNRTGQQVIFKKDNGQWKIYEAKIKKIEYIE